MLIEGILCGMGLWDPPPGRGPSQMAGEGAMPVANDGRRLVPFPEDADFPDFGAEGNFAD